MKGCWKSSSFTGNACGVFFLDFFLEGTPGKICKILPLTQVTSRIMEPIGNLPQQLQPASNTFCLDFEVLGDDFEVQTSPYKGYGGSQGLGENSPLIKVTETVYIQNSLSHPVNITLYSHWLIFIMQ